MSTIEPDFTEEAAQRRRTPRASSRKRLVAAGVIALGVIAALILVSAALGTAAGVLVAIFRLIA